MDKNELIIKSIEYDHVECYAKVTVQYENTELKYNIPTARELSPEEIKELIIKALS